MSYYATCCNFLKTFDHYGIRPSLFFKGKTVKGTGFGCCLTFSLLVITIVYFFLFGQNLYYRKNPNLTYHDEYTQDPEPIIIDPETFPILIELNNMNASTFFTDPRLITAEISQYTRINMKEQPPKKYRMEVCNKTHISKLDPTYQDYFLTKNLSNFFCIPNYLKNLTMEGAFDRNVFHTLKFSFSICKNESNSSITCRDQTEITRAMDRGFIGMYFLDFAIDPGNFENPSKLIPKEVFTNFVLNSQKEIDIYFKNNYLKSEEGVLFDYLVDYKIFNYEETQEMNFMVNDPQFLSVFFKIKQKKMIFERNYEKMQDVLGLLGGFLNFFYLLGWLLNILYVRLVLITDILLDIFTIKISKPKEPSRMKLISDQNERITNPAAGLLSPMFPLNSGRERVRSAESATYTLDKTEKKKKNTDGDLSKSVEFGKISKKFSEIYRSNSEILIKHVEKDEIDLGEIASGKKIRFMDVKEDNINSPLFCDRIPFKHSISANAMDLVDITEIDKLQLSTLDYLYIYLGIFKTPEREHKKLMINKGLEIMRKCLDVKFIIQKFYEIEKLKQLLLSESQLDLFKFLPKPEIILNIRDDSKKRHSIHTKVLMRNSIEDIKLSENDRISALMRNSRRKADVISNKLSKYAGNL